MAHGTETSHAEAPGWGVDEGVRRWTAFLCWLTVALDGFDLVALGASIPTILQTTFLGMDAAAATFVATISLVGVGIGAASVGPIADRVGRRVNLLGSILLFSIFTLLVPLAPSVGMLGVFRFVAGLGLGACLPTALTVTSEVTPAARRASSATITMTGYHVGAVLTSLLALAVVPHWQTLFYVGGALALLTLPLMWFKLPESSELVGATEPTNPRTAKERVPLSAVLKAPYLVVSIGTWVGSFMGLLLVYGLNTWLPTIMKSAGYPIADSLVMLLVLNAGGVAGLFAAGRVADARGIKPSTLLWYLAAAVFLALLSIRMPTLLLDVVIFLTGFFVFSAQVLIYALVAHLFPHQIRGTALGLASGIGRFGAIFGPAVTGALVTAGPAYPWGFSVFAVVAVLAIIAIAFVPANLRGAVEPVPADAG